MTGEQIFVTLIKEAVVNPVPLFGGEAMATIKEIARLADVSIGTVDRVIHNRGRVSKETEKRIRQIIENLNFKPNVFARNLKLSKTFNLGILMPYPHQDSKYWEMPARGIRRASEELASHKVTVSFFHYDKYSEISFQQVNQQIENRKLDGLLVAPVISRVFGSFLEQLPENLPYVFFDSIIPGGKCISYIGQDSYQSGVLAGKLMGLLLKDAPDSTVAVVEFFPTDSVIEARASGFDYYTGDRSQTLTRLKTKTYHVDEKLGDEGIEILARRMISEHNDLRGIFVTYAATYKFARFFQEMAPEKDIHIIGYDPVEENIKYLKSGAIDFLISQMPERQGYESIYTLYRHVVLGETVDARMMMPIDILTKENVDYYFGP